MEKMRIHSFGLSRSEYSQSGAFQLTDGTISVSLDPRDFAEMLLWSSEQKIQHVHIELLAFDGVPKIELNAFPRVGALETLSFSGYFVPELIEGLDDLLRSATNLKAFISSVESPKFQIPSDAFRCLERLQIKWSQLMEWDSFGARQSLRDFRIDNYSGKLQDIGLLPCLNALYLYDSKLEDITEIGHNLPSLKTLVLSNCTRKIDIEPLDGLVELENLKIEKTKVLNESRLVSPSLRRAHFEEIGDPNFFSQNPQIEWLRVDKYDGEITSDMLRLGWDSALNGFGGSKGQVPEELRS